ncbi:hypothetical protein JCM11641_003286 [Rhodosporidiobolus odoratus]
MSLALFFRSFICALLLSCLFALPAVHAAHSHLFPPSTTSNLESHHAHAIPRLITRQLLKQRQAVAPPSSVLQATRKAVQVRVVERQLRVLGRATESVREEIERGAERVKRAVQGAKREGWAEAVGEEIHDVLFHLLRLISSTISSASLRGDSTTPVEPGANFPVGAVRPAAASASPLPSGRAHPKRSLVVQPPTDPLLLLSILLSKLSSTVSSVSSVLPYLPSSQQAAIEALVEEIEGEMKGLVEGTVWGLGLVGVVQESTSMSGAHMDMLASFGTRTSGFVPGN